MASVLDTHQAVKDLTAASLSDAQAEAIVRLLQQSRDADFAQLVTKTDLREEALKLDRRIDGVEQRLDRRIGGLEHRLEAMENRLLVRLGGLTAAGIGIVAVLVAIF
jgi:hypothetical protein